MSQKTLTAEDIAADSFVKLWHQHAAFTNHKAIKVYLYKTARNAAIDYLRHQRPRRTHQAEVRYLNVVSEETILARRIETEPHQLYTALKALPPQCGKVFSMFYLEGKTYHQIAEELQLSIHTVRNQKVRALALLRGKLTVWLLLAAAFLLLYGHRKSPLRLVCVTGLLFYIRDPQRPAPSKRVFQFQTVGVSKANRFLE